MASSQPARLLVVDDEPALMATLRDTLREEGYHVTAVESAKLALEALKHGKYDLLLTDLVMPEKSGIELIDNAIKLDPFLSAMVMTGHGSIPTAVDAMKTGAIDYVLKPIKLSALLPAMERALTLRRLRTRNAELERKLKEHAAQLEAANRDLESFSSSISHDLRTPLRTITGFAELLLDPKAEALSADTARYLEFIKLGAKEMADMIEGLLAFSRFGRHAINPVTFDLSDLCTDAYEQLAQDRANRQVELVLQPAPKAFGDPLLLRQVVTNLLSNAIKYSRPREQAVIVFGAQTLGSDPTPVYFVRDNGVGFDMAHARNLFDVFHRIHSAEEFEGTGVGLATTRRIIERHGGRIWAESAKDAGATFFFTLPSEADSPVVNASSPR